MRQGSALPRGIRAGLVAAASDEMVSGQWVLDVSGIKLTAPVISQVRAVRKAQVLKMLWPEQQEECSGYSEAAWDLQESDTSTHWCPQGPPAGGSQVIRFYQRVSIEALGYVCALRCTAEAGKGDSPAEGPDEDA